MKNILKTFGLHLGVFLVLVFSLGIAYAAWDSTVNTGDQLTASSWNQLVGKVKTMNNSLSFSGDRVGIGTDTPDALLSIEKESDWSGVSIRHYTNGQSTHPYIVQYSADGTKDNPTYLSQDKVLAAIVGRSILSPTSESNIYMRTSEQHSSTHGGTDIRFGTTNNGTTSATEKMIIAHNGNVGIGTMSPGEKLAIGSYQEYDTNMDLGVYIGATNNDGVDVGESYAFVQKINGQASIGGNRLDFIRKIRSGTDRISLTLDSAGNVGIGTTSPNQKLEVNGTALASAWNTTSDRRLKTNIEELESPLEKLESIRGVSFDWKKNNKHDIGVIAQEVEAVLPEIVTTDDEGIKSVDYSKLTPLLIEVAKQQQKQIQYLTQEIELLKTK